MHLKQTKAEMLLALAKRFFCNLRLTSLFLKGAQKNLLAKLFAINKTAYSLPTSTWLCVSLTEHANRETKSYSDLSFYSSEFKLNSVARINETSIGCKGISQGI